MRYVSCDDRHFMRPRNRRDLGIQNPGGPPEELPSGRYVGKLSSSSLIKGKNSTAEIIFEHRFGRHKELFALASLWHDGKSIKNFCLI